MHFVYNHKAVPPKRNMKSQLLLCFILACLPSISAQENAVLSINGAHALAETDENFVCATLDWWPPDKCDYGQCQWGNSSALNLNLSHPFLGKAIQAFEHLRIRVGGSLEDQLVYGVPSLKSPCLPFRKQPTGLFEFSWGCLPLDRWDALNDFFNKTGLNALYGRRRTEQVAWNGPWDSSNARDFMNYTVSKGYPIDSWEFGNELCGSGIAASVDAKQYGRDLINLRGIMNELYKNSSSKALLVAPGGFFDKDWFAELVQVSGSGVINTLSHHIYNLGSGNDTNLLQNILDPDLLSNVVETYSMLNDTIQQYGPWASSWVSEAGGVSSSGGLFISHTFVNTFWYLDQLGIAALYNTKVFCRQTLIGGNYGLLNLNSFVPNPDYYSALLWNRLMGKKVLVLDIIEASSSLRAYAHCTKGRASVTLLLINLNPFTTYKVKVQNTMNKAFHNPNYRRPKQGSFKRMIKRAFSWTGSKISDGKSQREEYRLTPKDGNLRSETMLLNGKPLNVSQNGDIPSLEPAFVSAFSPIHISPFSIAFIVFPQFEAPTCLL